MRLASGLTLAMSCLSAAPSEAAEPQRDFAIRAGTLDETLVRFGNQAGLSIGLSDPVLAARRTRGVRGSYTTSDALRRLLDGTGAAALFVDRQTVRIVRAAPATAARAPRPLPPAPRPRSLRPAPAPFQPTEAVSEEIVVTASKQSTPLDRYAGSVDILVLDIGTNAREASRGTAAILGRLPALASTSLGPGRDKLFIRGVADSSFNGPSQSTVGQYLGDVRLTYNAPDPDLNLYDIGRVEVLEGPQGTLYGTGSLGGIIRLVPNAPDASGPSGSVSAGAGAVTRGGIGGDLAAMINLPLAADRLALRGVGYGSIDPGYIDDPGRGLRDINRTQVYGGRAALRFEPGARWTIDIGTALQNIDSRDGQYQLKGQPSLTRTTRIAQPFYNDYRLAYIDVGKVWGTTTLSSTTAIVRQKASTTYDATGFSGTDEAAAFEEDIGITLISQETRLSGRYGRHSWVAGLSGVHDISRLVRRLGDPDDPPPIAGVRNRNSELALFGQYSLPLFGNVIATAGARLVYARMLGTLIDSEDVEANEPHRGYFRALPTVALSWRWRDDLLAFARFQQGFRAGGIAVSANGPAVSSEIFTGDSLAMMETGLRYGQRGRDAFSASVALSYTAWSDIQSDLVDRSGLPFTINIGDGRIYGLQAQAAWMPLPGLTLEASTFLNKSMLHSPEPRFADAEDRELPNIATTGGRVAFAYRARVSPISELTLDGALRYVGESQLGIGAPLDVGQGNYYDASLGGRLSWGRFGVSLDVRNLLDVRGNRFAFGNPFAISQRNQVTPLRPRNVRIGIDARF